MFLENNMAILCDTNHNGTPSKLLKYWPAKRLPPTRLRGISRSRFRNLEIAISLGRFSAVLRSFFIVFLLLCRLQTDFFPGAHACEVVGSHRQHEFLVYWSIGDGTFSLEFNPYQVAPYSEGFVQVEVPMDLIRAYLTPFARGRQNH